MKTARIGKEDMRKEEQSGLRKNIIWISLCLFLLFNPTVRAQSKMIKELDLSGSWKFSIGDNNQWSLPAYNDRSWEKIKVPSPWEDQGFYGYDGYAWYRFHFDGELLRSSAKNYHLMLGYIDDIDEVFLNGIKIGQTGAFPSNYQTAYDSRRDYFITRDQLNETGDNVIAVRVYDHIGQGGIVSGEIGIYSNRDENLLDVNLRGIWDFRLTDDFSISRYDLSESLFNSYKPNMNELTKSTKGWVNISVPGHWENQGFKDYNGNAIYRKECYFAENMSGGDMVLILGKIDDFDKTYFNGHLVGSSLWYDKFRAYTIPAEIIKACETNVIEVYVHDKTEWGGFSEGPIGLIKQENFTRFMRWRN